MKTLGEIMTTIREIVTKGVADIMKSRGGYRTAKVNDFITIIANRELLMQQIHNDSLSFLQEDSHAKREDWMQLSTKTVTDLRKQNADLNKVRDSLNLEIACVTDERDTLQMEVVNLKQDLKSKSAQIKHLEGSVIA